MYGSSYNYGLDSSLGNSSSIFNLESAGIWVIISFVVALVGGICLYFTVFSDKNENNYTGFMAKLYEFIKFKKMYITTILKVSYLILAIFITLSSFSLISTSFVGFLLTLLFGNLTLRIVYEFSLVLLSIHENVSQINKKIKK